MFAHISDVAENIVPTFHNGSKITAGFVEFLVVEFLDRDLCNYEIYLESVYLISLFVRTTGIRE